MPPHRDHYAVLGLSSAATDQEIRTAFRRLARAHHPDANQVDPDAERRFKQIARAYEVLRNPARRRRYDLRFARRFGAPGPGGAASFAVDAGPIYHSDLGHHSDFYQAGDPLSIGEAAALVNRNPDWLRRAVRAGRLPAEPGPAGYLLRRRAVEHFDRMAPRRRRAADALTGSEGPREG